MPPASPLCAEAGGTVAPRPGDRVPATSTALGDKKPPASDAVLQPMLAAGWGCESA
jgi:hypothetical protein